MDVRDPGRELLVLSLGPARFGAWVDEVLEIVRTPPISRLPLAHPEVLGVTSVRGDVVPVLDLGARLLGVPAVQPGRLVLVRHRDSNSLVGLLVDGADRLLDVHEGELQRPPAAAEARLPAELMTGVVSRDEEVVTVLHIGRAAAPPVPANDER
jgi:chemotaxis signal transduction protein